MKTIFLLMAIFAICTACTIGPERQYYVDQTKRAELFQMCLKAVPAGPQSTHYNDWSEVVANCDGFAYRTSLKCVGKDCPEITE